MFAINIKELSRQQYEHLFEIDKIKRALFVLILEHSKLLKNYRISKSKLRRIELLLKDFKIISYKLIRCEIESCDEYVRASKTLLIIISKVRSIIRSEKGVKDRFGKVYRLLPFSESKLQSLLNGYFTRIVVLIVQVVLFAIAIATLIAYYRTPSSQAFNVFLIICGMNVLFSIIRIVFYRKIENNATLDIVKRIIDKNIHFDKSIDSQIKMDFFTTLLNRIK